MDSAPKVSGFNAPGSWSWPEGLPRKRAGTPPPRPQESTTTSSNNDSSPPDETDEHSHPDPPPRQRNYKPRTCRICLETVLPTYEPSSTSLPGYLQGMPKVVYESEDGGRLIRPCKCKGSQRYVHEGCLQEWRHADPGYGARNFWQCPTCGYKYRLERMRWGHWISSRVAQVALTFFIFVSCIFILGFVADPIISAYVDPVGWVANDVFGDGDDYSSLRYNRAFVEEHRRMDALDSGGWVEHFGKGFASLGVLGFLKMLWGLGPIQWLNVRSGGLFGGSTRRMGNTGRDRVSQLNWFVLAVGVCTFLFTVWKAVRALSRRFLEKAGERVMDVPLAPGEKEDYDDDDDE